MTIKQAEVLMKKLLLSAVAAVFAITAGVSEVAAKFSDDANVVWNDGLNKFNELDSALRAIWNLSASLPLGV